MAKRKRVPSKKVRKVASKRRPNRRPRRSAKPRRAAKRPAAKARRRVSRPAAAPTPAPAAAPSNAIGCVSTHFDYTTHSIADMKAFYAGTLGFTDVTHDPRFDYFLVRTGPGSSLGFMPPMPGPPEQWRPPREPAIYLYVEDVDRAHRELRARGVTFQQDPADMPWGHRVAILRDPEGRQVFLAQPIAR